MAIKPIHIFFNIAAILLVGVARWSPLVFSQVQKGPLGDSDDLVRWDMLLPRQEQRAKVYFGKGYMVGGVLLEPGKYLVVHREFAETQDEGTYFFRLPLYRDQAPAAKLRCTPIDGRRAEKFTINASSPQNGISVVRSIQFPGSTEIHTFERANIYLGHSYLIGGVALAKGRYVVVHRTDKDDQDDACLFVYRLPYKRGQEPAAKAECTPLEGEAVEEFTIRSTAQSDGTSVVRSIQFPGSSEIHSFATGS